MTEYTAEIGARLRTPFPEDLVKWREGSHGKRFAYVDSRHVMDRLDEVVGPGGWSTAYRVIDPERWAVECRLTVLGVERADIGYPNAAPEAARQDAEPLKSAYTDAFKRAAVEHGVGRFLYDLEPRDQKSTGGNRTTGGRQMPPWEDDGAMPKVGGGVLTLATTNGQPKPVVLPATEPQIKAIYAIARGAQAMDETETEDRCKELYGVLPAELSRRQASEFIDVLKSGGN